MSVPPPFTAERADRLAELQDTHFWFAGRRRAVASLLGSRLGRGGRTLDLGCGAGGMLGWLAAHGHEPVGVDSSETALGHARRRAPGCTVVSGTSTALPFPDGSFDGVLALDVLEHVDDRATLAEARRVSRPGAWLVASVPAWPSLWGIRDVDAGHLRRYTHRSLVDLVRRSGFTVERITYYQCALFPVFVAARVLGRRSRPARDAEEAVGPGLNRLLTTVNGLEGRLIRIVDLPVGSSLLVRARRA